MATRRPPGLRGGWAATQPADAVLTRPAEDWQHTRPHEGWPHRPPADDARPREDAGHLPRLPPAHTTLVRPAHGHGHAPTRAPAPPTRPAELPPAPTSRLANAVASATHTSAVHAPALLSPPALVRSTQAATAPASALPPAPAAPRRLVMAGTGPAAAEHWQVAGASGQHLVLMPGQMHLGQQVASLRTLLGSCVAITLWHPGRRIGGMCHYLLPSRPRRGDEPADGRYGDEAVATMVQALKKLRALPQECVAHLYGGADTMSGVSAARFNIGERNIEQGWTLIDRYGFQLDGVDVGDDVPRMVSLSLADGTVSMRRGSGSAPDPLRD